MFVIFILGALFIFGVKATILGTLWHINSDL